MSTNRRASLSTLLTPDLCLLISLRKSVILLLHFRCLALDILRRMRLNYHTLADRTLLSRHIPRTVNSNILIYQDIGHDAMYSRLFRMIWAREFSFP